jgi:hypothetical protein
MSHESPLARYVGARPSVFALVNRQVGSKGLHDFEEFAEMDPPAGGRVLQPLGLLSAALVAVVGSPDRRGLDLGEWECEQLDRRFVSRRVGRDEFAQIGSEPRSTWLECEGRIRTVL